MRVGEKETSEQAAIVARFADLFTRATSSQRFGDAEASAAPDERERLARLTLVCRSGSWSPRWSSSRTSSRTRYGRRASPSAG